MWELHAYNNQGDYLGLLAGNPLEVDAYERYPLRLQLETDLNAQDFDICIAGRALERRDSAFAFGSGESERGRLGEIAFDVYYRSVYQATTYIAITKSHLDEEQYHFLLADLKRLISLASQDDTVVRSLEATWEYLFVDFFDRRLQAILTHVEAIRTDLTRIEHAPQRAVAKRYHLKNEQLARRIDSRTIRWNLTNANRFFGHVLTYSNIEHTDLYENRLIAAILDRIRRYLVDLPMRFARTLEHHATSVYQRTAEIQAYVDIDGAGAEERRTFRLKQIKQLQCLAVRLADAQREHIPHYEQSVRGCLAQLDTLRQSPLLVDLHPEEGLRIVPTLIMLRDPSYNAIYNRYRQIQQDLQIDEQQRLETMLSHVPIERISKLYEYWVLLQVYVELQKLGFSPATTSLGIWAIIDRKTFHPRPNSQIELVGAAEVYTYKNEVVRVRLSYEPRLGGNKGGLCPDILLEFMWGELKKILILDAKYRNYDDPHCPRYADDIEEVAHQKYKLLRRRVQRGGPWVEVENIAELRASIHAAFIIHSHEDTQRFLDYGSEGKRNQYGAISLVPSERTPGSTHLHRLLTMFLRKHFNICNICWSDNHSHPVVAQRVQQTGGHHRKPWEWEYHCPTCDNRWWVNHCGHCRKRHGIHEMKITFADPSDNFYAFDERIVNNKRLLKCALCNQSYWAGV